MRPCASVGLARERRVFSLGHVGSAIHPIGHGCPVCRGNGLHGAPHTLVLAGSDGEADVHLAADGHDGMDVEAPGHVGSAIAQLGHQHAAGASGYGEERGIAPLAGIVAALSALL